MINRQGLSIWVRIKYDQYELVANEDPFIWSKHFLYSFCHVGRFNFRKNDVFIFLSPSKKSNHRTVVDTVVWCFDILHWPKPQVDCSNNKKNIKYSKSGIIKAFKAKNIQLNDRQIRHHIPIAPRSTVDIEPLPNHNNLALNTCIGDSEKSFLPITDDCESLDLQDYLNCNELTAVDDYIKESSKNERIRRSINLNTGDNPLLKKIIASINANTRYAVVGSDLVNRDNDRQKI